MKMRERVWRDDWLEGFRLGLAAILLAIIAAVRPAAADPNQGPGGPILVITSGESSAKFGKFYAEILRNEGFNAFAVADISAMNATMLGNYDLAILAKMTLTSGQAATLTDWVNGGGNLIAMDPGTELSSLLGISAVGSTLSNAYVRVNNSILPGNGIYDRTMQFHGTATLHSLTGASRLATLYSSSTVATSYPAVTLRNVGPNGGQAAAFAYDLAASIVYTRQGNPAWVGQERDGFPPIRADDLFYGGSASDPQPHWIDLDKVSVPQADEQQRFLANLITQMTLDRKPMPRFWYLPKAHRAALMLTGDEHGGAGWTARFNDLQALGTPGCSVVNWECPRATVYTYPNTPVSNTQAAAYESAGFEVALHVTTSCVDFDASSINQVFASQLGEFAGRFPGVAAPTTNRTHCIVWSDWATGVKVGLTYGIRLDTNYYYWPPGWVNNTPGHFTGSAMPMRFADLDGTLIDVYQAVTQITDESQQLQPFTIDTLLDRALGPDQHFGVITVNAHTDSGGHEAGVGEAVIASAIERGVPIVTARQMLDWLDARNASRFEAIAWSGNTLTFMILPGVGANGLTAQIPARSGTGALVNLTRDGQPVIYEIASLKGLDYAVFDGNSGNYVATYAADLTAPTVMATVPASGATNVSGATIVAAMFNESMDPGTISASTFELRDSSGAVVASSIVYDAVAKTARLQPSQQLNPGDYTATVRGGSIDPRAKDLLGNALAASVSWSFTVGEPPPPGSECPCSAFAASEVPAIPSANDSGAVELGVRFRSSVNGFVTGLRFFKGASNTGTHVGNLWSSAGALLATATFTGESPTGWQTVTLSSPIAVTANTVYVASYFAPNGGYAASLNYFASSGVTSGPLYLLRDGESGGNGLYRYGASSGFPTETFQSTNYWVDVVFTTTGITPDTTPPAVAGMTPTSGATDVPVSTTVTATFSEPLNATTVSSGTFELRDSGNALVTTTVSYSPGTSTATLTPSTPLAAATTYTATVRGGATDPRIKDLAGNALAQNEVWTFSTGAVAGCVGNPIVVENCQPGNPASEWDVSGVGDPSIQGFATDISVNRGGTIGFKVDTDASNYRLDIYRLGYYGGLGARKVATVLPSASLPQNQPNCLSDATTGLIDCGNWALSGSWAVPANAISGIYVAKVVRTDTNGASHIVFIVRNDSSSADILFQTADTTWQAYNTYGGNSLYTGLPAGRAYKVSYNRPFATRGADNGQDWLFNAEYPMVRWLEANGYHVSYTTGVDSERAGARILNHRMFMSNGHDEYWSAGQRANIEAARNAGVHLAFFSGNEVFWKTRWENSIDGSGTPHRTLVSYKETHANAKIDPTATWTGTWRDPRFSPPADGGRPENALTGQIFTVNDGPGGTTSIVVPEVYGKMRLWRNTSVSSLAPGASATLPFGTLGYEWDEDLDNGFRPAGLVRLSSTTVNGVSYLQDYGSTYASGNATHTLTLYKAPSGALVFGAGTVQWAWGLDANHDRAGTPADARMRQATVNLFADMGVQPETLQPGLVAAFPSTDSQAPTSTIASPAAGATLEQGTPVTITGTATDAGGGLVGGVEVSVDGGTTWRRANGRANWTYAWTPTGSGSVVIQSRAVDDSANLETPGAGRTVTVSTGPAPVNVPNVVGLTQAAATTAITTAGLVVGTVTQQASATVPSGSVISQSPVSGTSVAAGSAVNLVVSTGPAPVNVPNVVGLTQAAATTAITTAGLVVGTVTQQASATVPSGSVISQSPVSGTSVAAGSAVNLVVSTGPAPVNVPNVVGLTQAAATTALTNAGLVVGTVTQQASATVPSGSVISQSPVSGTSVAAGSAVNLVVSTGPAPVNVPNVVGLTQAAATTAITNAGLVVGTVTQQASATVPSGSVISQSPVSGTSVAAGSAVNLVVSTGPAPVNVPNVVGLTQAAATTAITNAGLVVGTVTQQASATVPSGSVISQSPVSGTSVAAGSAVNLVVSTGPAPVNVPNVVGLTQAAATTAITNAGLVVGTVTQQASATVPSGSVISQSPVSGTSVAAGSAVNLVVSTGPAPVNVPNVVGLTQAAATTAITNAGLVVGTVTQQASATVPSGSVISQSPVSGTSVAAGSAVNLVVSTGPAPVNVPNVVGLTQAAATTAITNAGLVVGTVTQQASATVPSGSVISQSPVSGTSVAAGSAVNLVVSTGPALDTQAPTAPGKLRATLVNGRTQVQLTWNASTDNVGVVEYIVYRGTSGNVLGPEVARVATPGWVDSTVTTGSRVRYTYAVKARDAANNLSGTSNWSSIIVP